MITINPTEASKHQEIVDDIAASGEPYEISAQFNLADFGVRGLEENRPIVVERKAADDFWSSVKDRRLWSQAHDLERAKEEGYTPIVIVELSQLAKLTFNPKTRRRMFVETMLFKQNELGFYQAELGVARWGVSIILTSSPHGTAKFLIDQSKKLGQPKEHHDYPERQGFRKNMTISEKRLYLFEAVGFETAKALLAHYRHPRLMYREADQESPEEMIRRISEIQFSGSGRKIGMSKAHEVYDVLFNESL